MTDIQRVLKFMSTDYSIIVGDDYETTQILDLRPFTGDSLSHWDVDVCLDILDDIKRKINPYSFKKNTTKSISDIEYTITLATEILDLFDYKIEYPDPYLVRGVLNNRNKKK